MATADPAPAPMTTGDDRRLRRDLGPISLLFTGIGSVIGSGWLFGSLNAAQLAGPASIVAWVVGGAMMLLIGLCYAEVGVMFPHTGGVARFPHYSFGSFASLVMGWIAWLAAASAAPIEVEAALQYATAYLPWLTSLSADGVPVLTPGGYGVAAVLMFAFCVVNILGVRWFARVNTALVWWKLAVIVLVVVVFAAVSFDQSHFTQVAGFAPYGADGVFAAIATGGIAFSYLGFRQGVELAGEARNPRRTVPLTLIGSVVICGVVYLLLQVAFLGAVPSGALAGGWSEVGTRLAGNNHVVAQFGPLATIAEVLGVTWLAVLLYIDAVVSPADTGLIFTTVTARLSYAMSRNGTAPPALAWLTRRGVPWLGIVLSFVVGLIFFLPFPGWQKLVGFITSAMVLSYGSGPLVLIAMRKQLPDRERRFFLRGGMAIPFLAFWSSNLIVYWSGWDTLWKLFAAVAFGVVLLGGRVVARRGQPSRLDLKHGIWVVVWIGGLFAISYLGSFPDPAKGSGNLGVIGFAGGLGATFALSTLVMWLAQRYRLPRERVEELVGTPVADEVAA